MFTHTQLHLAADLHRRASQQEAGRHSNGGRVHNSPKAGFIAAPAEGINGKSLGRKKKGGGGVLVTQSGNLLPSDRFHVLSGIRGRRRKAEFSSTPDTETDPFCWD